MSLSAGQASKIGYRLRPWREPVVPTPEWIKGMGELMMTIQDELAEAGELLAGHGLVDPSQAKTVRFEAGAPVSTDGPYAEINESLAGYWMRRDRRAGAGDRLPRGRIHRASDGGPAGLARVRFRLSITAAGPHRGRAPLSISLAEAERGGWCRRCERHAPARRCAPTRLLGRFRLPSRHGVASRPPRLTTRTGQAAWWRTCWLTEPSSSPVNPPRPRAPTTTSWAISLSRIRIRPG